MNCDGISSHCPNSLTHLWAANSLLELVGVFMPQMQDNRFQKSKEIWVNANCSESLGLWIGSTKLIPHVTKKII